MTRLVYLGSEVPSNRKLLLGMGVQVHGWSYMRAKKRGFPTTKRFSFGDYYPADATIIVHPGTSEVQDADAEQVAADYQDFIVEHLDEIDAFVEFDHAALGRHWVALQRPFWEDIGDKFWPVYDGSGADALTSLAQRYHEVVIPSAVLEADTSLAARTRALSASYDTVWHAAGVSSPENLRQVPFATASTLAWASPMMRGETIVWDGTRLVRYPKDMKAQARPRYRSVIQQAGLDYEAVLGDDAKEVTRLAIWSYLQMEKSMDRKRPHNPNNPFTVINPDDVVDHIAEPSEPISGNSVEVVDQSDSMDRHPTSRLPVAREPHERAYLPSMGVSTKTVSVFAEGGSETIRDVPVLVSNSDSMRQCDTCFVAANCPAMAPQSACAFSLPVEIRTAEQLRSLLSTVVEMQGARVAFAKYAEDLNGGYPDPNVGMEIDRLFKITGQLKEMEDNREFLKMTVERRGGAGMLSSIFGERAVALSDLPVPVDPVRVIQHAIED